MILSHGDNDLQFQGPWPPSTWTTSPPVPHDVKHMSFRLLFRLLLSSFSVFLMTAFCIGTFAEFVPHRWFGLWHILIAMKPWVQLLGCSELHNACAIQCTNKTIFLRPQMTWETDTWKGPYLAECLLTWMCFLWRPGSYFEGWWSVRRSGHHPTRLSHIYFCCCLVHFTLVWFVFCS